MTSREAPPEARAQGFAQHRLEFASVRELQHVAVGDKEPDAFKHADLPARRQKKNLGVIEHMRDRSAIPGQILGQRRNCTNYVDIGIGFRDVPDRRSGHFCRDHFRGRETHGRPSDGDALEIEISRRAES